jgi:hypothetical protein
MADICLSFWLQQKSFKVHIVTPELLDCPLSEFNLKRRIYADVMARTSVYVLTDDDCLPECSAVEAHQVAVRHCDFGMLSLMPSNANIVPWAEATYDDDEVMEHVDTGGCRFLRKGVVKEWPPSLRKGYDREHSEAIREAGLRVGYFKELCQHHLGEGRSELWCQSVSPQGVTF